MTMFDIPIFATTEIMEVSGVVAEKLSEASDRFSSVDTITDRRTAVPLTPSLENSNSQFW